MLQGVSKEKIKEEKKKLGRTNKVGGGGGGETRRKADPGVSMDRSHPGTDVDTDGRCWGGGSRPGSYMTC